MSLHSPRWPAIPLKIKRNTGIGYYIEVSATGAV